MSQLYFVLTRRCNQFCTSCPRHQEERIADEKYQNVKGRLFHTLEKFEVDDLILSGGEPALYREFPELIRELDRHDVPVMVQSNGQRFADRLFAERCFWDCRHEFHVMTALHSMNASVHDRITGVPGSFGRAVEAIHNLLALHVRITVKCILSRLNAPELPEYLSWLAEEFRGEVELCVSGMDYIGMSSREKKEYMLDYADAADPLRNSVQWYEENRSGLRDLVLIELPLCMLEKRYWKYFRNTRVGEQLYQDAYMNYPARRCHDFTTDYAECGMCAVREQCPGVWSEQYKLYPGSCIAPAAVEN